MKEVLILDGGFSTELDKLGFHVDADPLWGAGALKTNQEAVLEVHKRYVSVGCDIITTSSYQASVDGFVQYLDVSTDEALQLIGDSVHLAQQAVAEQKRSVLVAGSVGPYGATQHDGSEYHGNYVDDPQWNVQALCDWHRSRVKALLEAGADFLALETQPSMQEALALLALLREFPNAKAWLSFSCSSDGRSTAHGESLKEAVKQCLQQASSSQLVAIGVNCCSPDLVGSLLKQVLQGLHEVGRSPNNLPLIAYPNSGEKFIPRIGWELKGHRPNFGHQSVDWLQVGATWLGGCCRAGPKDIALLRASLSDHVLTNPEFTLHEHVE